MTYVVWGWTVRISHHIQRQYEISFFFNFPLRTGMLSNMERLGRWNFEAGKVTQTHPLTLAHLPSSTLGLMANSWQSIAAIRSWVSVPPVSGSCFARNASDIEVRGIDRRKWCTDAWCWQCRTAHPGRSTTGSTRIAVESSLREGDRDEYTL